MKDGKKLEFVNFKCKFKTKKNGINDNLKLYILLIWKVIKICEARCGQKFKKISQDEKKI